MSPHRTQHGSALATWAPGEPLTVAEAQFIELLAVEASKLGGFRTRTGGGRVFVAEFGSDAAMLAAAWFERGRRAYEAGIWQVAQGAFGLALRAELHMSGLLTEAAAEKAGWLARTLRIRGNLPLARAVQDDVLDVRRQRLGAEHRDTLAAERQLGETLLLAGQFQAARSHQEHVLEGRIKALGEDHPDTAESHQDLGANLFAEGSLASAAVHLCKALDILRRSDGLEAHATIDAENGVASVLWAQGDLAGARALQEHVLEVSRRRGATDRELLVYEGNLAAVMYSQGHWAEAKAIQERALETWAQRFGRRHLDTLGAQNNLAWTLRASGDVDRARRLAQDAFDTCRELLGARHPTTFAAEGALVKALQAQGDEDRLRVLALDGLAKLATVASSIGNVSTRYAFLLRALEPQCVAAAARDPSRAAEVDWIAGLLDLLPTTSAAFRDALELCHADERLTSLAHYVEFHSVWVTLCVLLAPQRLPQALAPLHGLESWSALLTRLQDAGLASRSAPHAALLRARQELQQLRLRQTTLASMIDGMVRHIADLEATLRAAPTAADDGGDPSRRAPATAQMLSSLRKELDDHLATRAALRADEAAAIRRYRDARGEFAREDATLAALLAMPALTGTDLAARLRADEALLITVVLPGRGASVVVIRAGVTVVVELAGLAAAIALAARYQAHRRALMRGAGLRDGVLRARDARFVPDVVDAEPVSTALLADAMRAAFWLPLADALAGAQRVHLVTGPGHHSVPLECGAPPSVPVHRYFGLPAYLSVRDRPLPLPPLDEIDIVVDAAWGHTPIPFVEAEADLVHALLNSRGRARRVRGRELFEPRADARPLLLCVHGGVAGEAGREHGYLVLDAAAEPALTLDPPKVAALPAQIAEAYASACLGAVVGSNDTGSALGVCSEWQLRGVSSVVACLVPVEDHFMPLLAALFWHRRLQGQLPFDALEAAKAELRSGQWPTRLIEPLHRIYAATMRTVLARAAWRGDGGDHDGARRIVQTIGGWLLPPYVRSSHFEAGPIDEHAHRAFSAAFCNDAASAERLIAQCLGYLIDERADPEDLAVRPYARAAIDNICAFTRCFGSGGVAGASAREERA